MKNDNNLKDFLFRGSGMKRVAVLLVMILLVSSTGCIGEKEQVETTGKLEAMIMEAEALGWVKTGEGYSETYELSIYRLPLVKIPYRILLFRKPAYENRRMKELEGLFEFLNISESMKTTEFTTMAIGWIDTSDVPAKGALEPVLEKEIKDSLDSEVAGMLNKMGLSIISEGGWKEKDGLMLKKLSAGYPVGTFRTPYGTVDMGNVKVEIREYIIQSTSGYGIVIVAVPEDYHRRVTLRPLEFVEVEVEIDWNLHDGSLVSDAESVAGVVK
ncbi:hypothetical protein GQS_02655 [Thermococcus sp. 4557]|uniref:hypothetical protein n=1 Tax=Thermococcus sp. (strain CGMCC 1.5172 / 4557) TaxID=1042877 RepID=UPI000219EEAC|nr:hypothetical protein [Thermococcus sp. 4557]AEK72432.1 hypothetical protein GQS_02655 [Thermococcus sp. 4557]